MADEHFLPAAARSPPRASPAFANVPLRALYFPQAAAAFGVAPSSVGRSGEDSPPPTGAADSRFETPSQLSAVGTQVFAVASAIINMMAAVQEFRSSVPSADRDELPFFDWWFSIAMYYPVVFAPVVLMILHNWLSVPAFYGLLNHRMLLLFPPSEAADAMGHWQGRAFAVLCLLYYGWVCGLLLYFRAAWTVWLLMANQFLLGVVATWAEQLSIDAALPSLQGFIEAFVDDEKAEEEEKNEGYRDDDVDKPPRAPSTLTTDDLIACGLDRAVAEPIAQDAQEAMANEVSAAALQRAAAYLGSLRVIVSPKPSSTAFPGKYAGTYATRALATLATVSAARVGFRAGIIGVIGLVIAFAVWSLQEGINEQSQTFWSDRASPCVQVCVDVALLTSSNSSSAAGTLDALCGTCICRCLTMLQQPRLIDVCDDFLSVPQCLGRCDALSCVL